MAIFNKCSTTTFAVVAPAVAALKMGNNQFTSDCSENFAEDSILERNAQDGLMVPNFGSKPRFDQAMKREFLKKSWEDKGVEIHQLLQNSQLDEAERRLDIWGGKWNLKSTEQTYYNWWFDHEAHRYVELRQALKRKQEECKQEMLSAKKDWQWKQFDFRVDQIKHLIQHDKLKKAGDLLEKSWDFDPVPSDVVGAYRKELEQDYDIALASRPFKKHLKKNEFEDAAKLLKEKKKELAEGETRGYEKGYPLLYKTLKKWEEDLEEALLSEQRGKRITNKAWANLQKVYSDFLDKSFGDKKTEVHGLFYGKQQAEVRGLFYGKQQADEDLKNAGRLLTLWRYSRFETGAWKNYVEQSLFEQLEEEHSEVRAERMIEG